MARSANQPFTIESNKHVALDIIDTRVLETAMRVVAGLPVSDDDKAFLAANLGAISALWAKFRQFRTAFESVDMLAAMRAANLPVPAEPVANGTAN